MWTQNSLHYHHTSSWLFLPSHVNTSMTLWSRKSTLYSLKKENPKAMWMGGEKAYYCCHHSNGKQILWCLLIITFFSKYSESPFKCCPACVLNVHAEGKALSGIVPHHPEWRPRPSGISFIREHARDAESRAPTWNYWHRMCVRFYRTPRCYVCTFR